MRHESLFVCLFLRFLLYAHELQTMKIDPTAVIYLFLKELKQILLLAFKILKDEI